MSETVRVYGDFGNTAADYQAVLDTFYANGIMVIMDVINSKADIDSGRYLQVIQIVKNHPAILMWEIGNEWNLGEAIRLDIPDMAFSAISTAAMQARTASPHHQSRGPQSSRQFFAR